MMNAMAKDGRLADVAIKDSDFCAVCATPKQVCKTFKVNDEDSEVTESARSDAVVCSNVLGPITPALKSVHRDLHNDEESVCNDLPTAQE